LRAHYPVLESEHLAVVGFVVVAAQVQHAVDHGLRHVLGVLGADHDVAQLARAEAFAGLVDGKREDVGRAVDPAVLAVEPVDLVRVDEGDRKVAVGDTGGVESGAGGALVLGPPAVYLDLDGQALEACSL
jgi:hypothetical protein